jgi:Ser/Thr protein kinase RdoA (MazF antagonist)
MLQDLRDNPDFRSLEKVLDRFESTIEPQLVQLPKGVLHNDFNTDNVLVTPDGQHVAGLLDFDDLVVTQVVNDLAATAYGYVGTGEDPLAPALDVVRGYHKESQLSEGELTLLPDLMKVRLATYLIISEWLSRRSPQNRGYLTRKAPLAWAQFHRLDSVPAEQASEHTLRTCTT